MNKRISHSPVARDRGPSKHFRGRKKILRNFSTLTQESLDEMGGTTFLIHGAPGVGKTALLYECEKIAVRDGWRVAKIKPGALWNPDQLMFSLGKKRKPQITKISGEAGVDSVDKLQGGVEVNFDLPAYATLKILTEDTAPLILILDEAQALGIKDVIPAEKKGVVTDVLDYIHNGGLSRPLILLVAGVGSTLDAFESLSISRFADDCVIELGPLSKKSERQVIHAWLTKSGRAKGDPIPWIDAIVAETHRWPRHIHSYSKFASDYLQANYGEMRKDGLEAILQKGHDSRVRYYTQRVNKFDGDEIMCLSEALSNIDAGESFTKKLVTKALTKKYGHERSEILFKEFKQKGVISKDGYLYCVPIPSMHDWMKSELARAQEKLHSANSDL